MKSNHIDLEVTPLANNSLCLLCSHPSWQLYVSSTWNKIHSNKPPITIHTNKGVGHSMALWNSYCNNNVANTMEQPPCQEKMISGKFTKQIIVFQVIKCFIFNLPLKICKRISISKTCGIFLQTAQFSHNRLKTQ